MAGIERRQLERFDMELPAEIIKNGGDETEIIQLLTRDVSSGGAFLQTDAPLPVGTKVKMSLVLPLEQLRNIKSNKASIRVSGAVIRNTENGMAICFEGKFDIKPIND